MSRQSVRSASVAAAILLVAGPLAAQARKEAEFVISMAATPDGRLVAWGGTHFHVTVADGITGQVQHVLKGHTDNVTCLSFSPDGSRLVTGGDDRAVRVWDVATGKPGPVLKGGSYVGAVAFGPDGKTIATAGGDDALRLWDADTGQEKLALKDAVTGHGTPLAFSPDGRLVAARFLGEGPVVPVTVRVWETATGRRSHVFLDRKRLAGALAFSPDSKRLAVGYSGSAIDVIDLATREVVAEIRGGRDDTPWSLAYSPDGKSVLAGHWNGTAKLWDAATGQQKAALAGKHQNGVKVVGFRRRGEELFTVGFDKAVRFWDPATGQPTDR